MSSKTVIEIKDLAALDAFAEGLIKKFASRQVLLLDGQVGAGKTQFTKLIAENLGSSEAVSPSFAIHNRYDLENGVIDHVDLYRLENEDELESTGFWDLLARKEGLIIIEWAERLPANSLPPNWKVLRLVFEITGASSRRITVSAD